MKERGGCLVFLFLYFILVRVSYSGHIMWKPKTERYNDIDQHGVRCFPMDTKVDA